jgi:outer membrane protein assembly factor BamB
METTMFRISRNAARIALFAAFVNGSFAQMHGTGNMGGRSIDTTMISGLMAGMGNMVFGPVVGADGTAYALRQTVTTGLMTGTQSLKTELIAIRPSNGNVNWALAIDGTMISGPVLAKDGTILLTTSEPEMMTGSLSTASPALVIVAPAATTARVQARIPIASDMLSLPVVTPDGQTIYVIGTDMPDMPIAQVGAAAGNTYLYAFFAGSGNLKFKVRLR